jgi:hypothetical protein
MYHANLVTPFPKPEFSHRTYEPLIEATGIEYARQYITEAANKGYRASAELEVMQHIQEQVSRSLYWETGKWPQQATNNDSPIQQTVGENQTTNCGGFTVVTAELLGLAGIQNYVAYMNGHFMNLAVTDSGQQAYWIDGYMPELSQEVSNVLLGTSGAELMQHVNAQGRSAARIDIAQLITNIHEVPDDFTNRDKYRWLRYSKHKTIRYGSASQFNSDEEWDYRNRYTGIMQIYSSQAGQEIIPAYGRFLSGYTDGNIADALQAMPTLSGRFPELDARAEHLPIKALVSRLAEQSRIEDVLSAIYHYCRSFSISKDPRLKGLEAGLYYDTAMITGDEACGGIAIQAYREAMERARYRSATYNGKLDKLAAAQFGAAVERVARIT